MQKLSLFHSQLSYKAKRVPFWHLIGAIYATFSILVFSFPGQATEESIRTPYRWSQCEVLFSQSKLFDFKQAPQGLVRTIGVGVETPNGEIKLLVGHYIFSSHEWLYRKASEQFGDSHILWGGEMEWEQDGEGGLVLRRWNETSSYIKSTYKSMPKDEMKTRLEKFIVFLKQSNQWNAQSAQQVSFDEETPHFSSILNQLVSDLKSGAVRHTASSVIYSLYLFMENLNILREKQQPNALEKFYEPKRLRVFKKLFTNSSTIFELILEDVGQSLSENDRQSFKEKSEQLKRASEDVQGFFVQVYEQPELGAEYSRLVLLASKLLKGDDGLRSSSYFIFN